MQDQRLTPSCRSCERCFNLLQNLQASSKSSLRSNFGGFARRVINVIIPIPYGITCRDVTHNSKSRLRNPMYKPTGRNKLDIFPLNSIRSERASPALLTFKQSWKGLLKCLWIDVLLKRAMYFYGRRSSGTGTRSRRSIRHQNITTVWVGMPSIDRKGVDYNMTRPGVPTLPPPLSNFL